MSTIIRLTVTVTFLLCSTIGAIAGKTKNEGTTTATPPPPAETKLADNSKMADEAKSMTSQENSKKDDIDLISVMTMCNESFRIEMAFLTSLNESGSFPDETDKTPKCYLRCILQSTEVASLDDGAIDAERAAMVFYGTRDGEPMEDILKMTTYCAEGRDETCKCEMAYNFLKCLFSMEKEKHSKNNNHIS